MSGLELDRERFMQFLNINHPHVVGTPTLVVDPSNDDGLITEYYFAALRVSVNGRHEGMPLGTTIKTVDLFPDNHIPFTVAELVTHFDKDTYHDHFLGQVRERLKLFRVSITWNINSLSGGVVADRGHMNRFQCQLSVSAKMNRPSGQQQCRYMFDAYTAVTDSSVPLTSFFNAQKLDEAWSQCAKSNIKFREFT